MVNPNLIDDFRKKHTNFASYVEVDATKEAEPVFMHVIKSCMKREVVEEEKQEQKKDSCILF